MTIGRSLPALFAAVVVSTVTGCDEPIVAPERPLPEGTSPAPPLASSELRVPITVSMDALRAYAESAVPPAVSGQKGLGNFGPAANNELQWSFSRSPLSVSGADGRIAVATSIGGRVTVHGSIQPIRGDLGRFLRRLRPSQPYSQSADVGVDFSASIAPTLRPDWRIEPNLAAQAIVREASARVVGIFDLSFRGELQGPLDAAVENERAKLAQRIVDDQTVRREAEKAWTTLCQPIPVRTGAGGPLLSLRISPIGFEASQPAIGPDGVRLDLGLGARLALVGANEPVGDCPPFPAELSIRPALDGTTVLSVDGTLDAVTVADLLEAQRKANPVWEANGLRVDVDRLALRPNGAGLVLAVEGRFSETRWFGAAARGTVYLTAKPVLDPVRRQLRLDGVALDVASASALDGVAAAFGQLLAPLLAARLEGVTIDLDPTLRTARERANAALAGAGAGAPSGIAVRVATVDDVSLAALWMDPDAIHVRAEAKGRIELAVTEIE